MTEDTRCADCGVVIHEGRDGRWYQLVSGAGHSYCCRADVRDGRLILADYHYPPGTKQRHWRIPVTLSDIERQRDG